MTCLGCTRCEDGPWKTLIDGRIVCHQCEDWRAECEARAVLAMPTVDARRNFFRDVERHRGIDAANALRSLVRLLWESGRPAGGGGR
jgi:hypothetical protein